MKLFLVKPVWTTAFLCHFKENTQIFQFFKNNLWPKLDPSPQNQTHFQYRKDNPSDERRAVGYFQPDVTAITNQLNFRRARSNPFAQINMQFVLDVQDGIFFTKKNEIVLEKGFLASDKTVRFKMKSIKAIERRNWKVHMV